VALLGSYSSVQLTRLDTGSVLIKLQALGRTHSLGTIKEKRDSRLWTAIVEEIGLTA